MMWMWGARESGCGEPKSTGAKESASSWRYRRRVTKRWRLANIGLGWEPEIPLRRWEPLCGAGQGRQGDAGGATDDDCVLEAKVIFKVCLDKLTKSRGEVRQSLEKLELARARARALEQERRASWETEGKCEGI